MMRKMMLAVVYTAFACGANAGSLDGLLVGDMNKLAVAAAPVALPDAEVLDASDGAHSLAEYKGKWVVLNFWASWCEPCQAEAPLLEHAQSRIRAKISGEAETDIEPEATCRPPITAMPTTAIVPTAMPVNGPAPTMNSPDIAAITVSPDTMMARPEVWAAIGAAPSGLTGFTEGRDPIALSLEWGVRRLNERSPASTWSTGMCSLEAARAPASVELVSP